GMTEGVGWRTTGGGPGSRAVAQADTKSAATAAPRTGPCNVLLRLRGVDVDQLPVGIAALQPPLEGPEFGGAPVLDTLALRTLGAAAELGQEAHRQTGQVGAHHFCLLQVGARRVEEFYGF